MIIAIVVYKKKKEAVVQNEGQQINMENSGDLSNEAGRAKDSKGLSMEIYSESKLGMEELDKEVFA